MGSRRSVMGHKFSEIPKIEGQRSSFDRSHGLKTTFDSGYLVPILVDEIYPGDTFNVNMTGFARLATPLKPILDNAFMDTFFFFVPMRLVWENWQKFMGEQEDPDDSIDYTIPTFDTDPGGVDVDSIHDYMGIPPGIQVDFNALPARCYGLIWDEWFRDENLQDSIKVVKTDSGGNPDNSKYDLQRRGKRHDYFTSCLPWPQKGDSVDLPLGASAPVTVTGTVDASGDPSFSVNGNTVTLGATSGTNTQWSTTPGTDSSASWVNPQLDWSQVTGTADLSSATAATINQIRQAFQIQRLVERDARGGTRYTEIIKSHFGVTSPDQRLQRPEYLGGGSTQIGFTPVENTADLNNNETPQGALTAYATASLHNHGFTKSFTEHGYIIGLVSVRADLTYQQGVNRLFSRSTRYDFYFPALSHIGEQAVLNKEIWTDGSANDDLVFGYQERYAELRYKPSLVTSLMRSDHAQTLDVWHLSQDFATLPVLDSDFIEENPPFQRIVAVQAPEPEFIFDAYFSMRCARLMPLYGTPGMIDHF